MPKSTYTFLGITLQFSKKILAFTNKPSISLISSLIQHILIILFLVRVISMTKHVIISDASYHDNNLSSYAFNYFVNSKIVYTEANVNEIGIVTNSICAEMVAIIQAIQYLLKLDSIIENDLLHIYSDCEAVVHYLNGKHKTQILNNVGGLCHELIQLLLRKKVKIEIAWLSRNDPHVVIVDNLTGVTVQKKLNNINPFIAINYSLDIDENSLYFDENSLNIYKKINQQCLAHPISKKKKKSRSPKEIARGLRRKAKQELKIKAKRERKKQKMKQYSTKYKS